MHRATAIAALLATAILLSLPGNWIESLQSFIHPWWPWPASGMASSGIPLDKVVHVSLFFVCGALFVRGWSFLRQRWYLLCGLLLLFGVLTELIQRYVPGRSASVGDLVADAVGILLGVGLALVYWRRSGPARE